MVGASLSVWDVVVGVELGRAGSSEEGGDYGLRTVAASWGSLDRASLADRRHAVWRDAIAGSTVEDTQASGRGMRAAVVRLGGYAMAGGGGDGGEVVVSGKVERRGEYEK